MDAGIWKVGEKEPKPVDLIKVVSQPLQKIYPTNALHPMKPDYPICVTDKSWYCWIRRYMFSIFSTISAFRYEKLCYYR